MDNSKVPTWNSRGQILRKSPSVEKRSPPARCPRLAPRFTNYIYSRQLPYSRVGAVAARVEGAAGAPALLYLRMKPSLSPTLLRRSSRGVPELTHSEAAREESKPFPYILPPFGICVLFCKRLGNAGSPSAPPRRLFFTLFCTP